MNNTNGCELRNSGMIGIPASLVAPVVLQKMISVISHEWEKNERGLGWKHTEHDIQTDMQQQMCVLS